MYPEKHDKPSDFPKLLKGDPYSIIRHPLYALAIVNQLSIPILFLSLQGLITFIMCLPLWYVLIKIEEKELIEYWGGEYLRYMKEVPALIPLPHRRSREKSYVVLIRASNLNEEFKNIYGVKDKCNI